MPDRHSIREVRKSECVDVQMYATALGVDFSETKLQHQLSLIAVDEDKEIVAATLCTLDADQRININVLSTEGEELCELIKEMTNRCLHKVQSGMISSARIHSPSSQPAEEILSQANWLDNIDEAVPQIEADPAPGPDTVQAA